MPPTPSSCGGAVLPLLELKYGPTFTLGVRPKGGYENYVKMFSSIFFNKVIATQQTL